MSRQAIVTSGSLVVVGLSDAVLLSDTLRPGPPVVLRSAAPSAGTEEARGVVAIAFNADRFTTYACNDLVLGRKRHAKVPPPLSS